MRQEQNVLNKISGIGIVAVFGVMTMSSSIVNQSPTTINTKSAYYYENYNFFLKNNTICNSSMLSKQAVGDIVSADKQADFTHQHKKIGVKLHITKISKHVSNFNFEEEFEEI